MWGTRCEKEIGGEEKNGEKRGEETIGKRRRTRRGWRQKENNALLGMEKKSR